MDRSRLFGSFVWLLLFLPGAARAQERFRYEEGIHGKGELRTINGLPVLKVEGTPEEIGEQTGMLTRHAAPGLTSYFKNLIKAHGMEPAWPLLVKAGNAMYPRFPEAYRKEIENELKVSDVDRDIVIVSNTLWDVSKLRGCSALLVETARSGTGGPLLGRNFDFPALGVLHDYSVLIICKAKDKHAFAAIGFPGLVGCTSGINDAGLALATLDVEATGDGSPKFDLSGTPLILTFRRILEECTTVDEAVKILRASKRTTLLNLAVCDKNGGAILELTPKNVAIRRPVDGLCACTNHFRTKELATSLTCKRYAILEKSWELPRLGPGDLWKQLDGVNQGAATIQTMVFEPATLRLHLALGKGPSSARPPGALELAPLFKKDQGNN